MHDLSSPPAVPASGLATLSACCDKFGARALASSMKLGSLLSPQRPNHSTSYGSTPEEASLTRLRAGINSLLPPRPKHRLMPSENKAAETHWRHRSSLVRVKGLLPRSCSAAHRHAPRAIGAASTRRTHRPLCCSRSYAAGVRDGATLSGDHRPFVHGENLH